MKSKELRAKRHQLTIEARALIDADAPSQEDIAKYEAMMLEIDALKAQIDRVERADELVASQMEDLRNAGAQRANDPEQEKERRDTEERAFMSWVRRGKDALNAEERKIYDKRFQNALGTTPDTAGGFTVPQGFYTKLTDAQLAYGGMLQAGFVFDTETGNALPIPTDNDTANKGAIIGENTQVATQDLTFGAVTMNAYTYSSKLVLVSNQLLQDSAFDLNGWLSDKLGIRIARILNDHFTTGDGASKPTGVVSAATLGYTAGGSTSSGSTATISFDDLIELEHSVDPAYRNSARYMMADSTLKSIKKLKDGIGRPLWMPGLAVKEPDTINQYPYSVNQSMAAMGASAKPVAFGDFSNYFIRRLPSVSLLRLTERYADFNQTGFLAFQRWDGNLIDAGTHPIKYLQNSAS